MPQSLDTSKVKEWRSIITLVVFIITNIVVLFPFHAPIFIPRSLHYAILDTLTALRVIAPRQKTDQNANATRFVRLDFPLNFLTAPIIADLFLLAILAIGRQEVHDGTLGADNISPLDIMIFFITLAYIATSIDASGLIRYMAFKVLQKGGNVGYRLFFYLYAFFFTLGSFIGNDPIILSGTPFLAYMTRVSANIEHPRAWVYTQFAVANIASTVLVSSNPTNLVLAGAFRIKFIHYTINMIVPVVVTAIVLFPFLLYVVFADETIIPLSIKMHELSPELAGRRPINPNIPNLRGADGEVENENSGEDGNLLSLEEIMNPFLDKGGAWFGAVIMTATLASLLAINAASSKSGEHPIFWVTLPAAVVMLCWDIGFGWRNRHETREIARSGQRDIERVRAEKAARKEQEKRAANTIVEEGPNGTSTPDRVSNNGQDHGILPAGLSSNVENNEKKRTCSEDILRLSSANPQEAKKRATLASQISGTWRWCQETFPTAAAVVAHLPFALVPFAFAMFVLVQALVTKGWVPVFAHGWNHWVNKTGTLGAVAGMGFLSVILCNFAGTNIGSAILLSRVIQAWQEIHRINNTSISDRTFWATVYTAALGLNYGAFSIAFSASLAGLLWRDILARKHINMQSLDFARTNVPIIAVSMAVGCIVLVGEVYIMRSNYPYDA